MRRDLSSGRSLLSSRSIAWRKALSVLPLPVGATTSAFLPSAMLVQAPSCAGVASANDASNHARVGALKRSRAVMLCSLSPRYDTGARPEGGAAGQLMISPRSSARRTAIRSRHSCSASGLSRFQSCTSRTTLSASALR